MEVNGRKANLLSEIVCWWLKLKIAASLLKIDNNVIFSVGDTHQSSSMETSGE